MHFCVVNFSLQFNASHVLPTVLHAGVPLAPSSTSMAHPSPGVCVFMLDLPKAMIFPPASHTFFSFHRTTTLSLPSVPVPSMVWCWVNIKFMQNLIIWCIQCLFFFSISCPPAVWRAQKHVHFARFGAKNGGKNAAWMHFVPFVLDVFLLTLGHVEKSDQRKKEEGKRWQLQQLMA